MTLVLVYLSFIISLDVVEGAARGGKKGNLGKGALTWPKLLTLLNDSFT